MKRRHTPRQYVLRLFMRRCHRITREEPPLLRRARWRCQRDMLRYIEADADYWPLCRRCASALRPAMMIRYFIAALLSRAIIAAVYAILIL